ncbi:MAG: flavodoxin family protein, partial [Anaerolineae bacterium]|nr:flavodoxin family protein [Anaerolineae bacterium]
ALVVYDSVFGNTEKVAQAVAQALGSEAVKVSSVTPEALADVKLLVVGSPTRAFRATPATMTWIKALPANALSDVRVAAFDTRISAEETGPAFLKLMVKLFGYAAKPILGALRKKGGQPAAADEGFIVMGTEGPLKDGELERAAAWAARLTG